MPPKKKPSGSRSTRTLKSNSVNNSDIDAYKSKRRRNNAAVVRTRQRSKQNALNRKENVEKLRIAITQKEAQIEEVKYHIEKLKELLLNNVEPEDAETTIQKILMEE